MVDILLTASGGQDSVVHISNGTPWRVRLVARMNVVFALAGQWVVILAAIVALVLSRQVQLRPLWVVAAVAMHALNSFALINGREFISLEPYFGELQWNFAGKIAAVVVTLLIASALLLIARKPFSASGLTFEQKAGSLAPAIVAALLLVGLSVGVEVWAQDGADTSAERLWFQATMPGLDEEPFWRGVLLLALNEALRGGRLNLLGAEISWGGVLLAVFFGLGHGVRWADGAFSFDWLVIAITGTIGFGLYWIRERTGSVILPIVAHNLINVSNSFF